MNQRWLKRWRHHAGTSPTGPVSADHRPPPVGDAAAMVKFRPDEPAWWGTQEGPVTAGSPGRGGWAVWHPAMTTSRRRWRWQRAPRAAGAAAAAATVAVGGVGEWIIWGSGWVIPVGVGTLVLTTLSAAVGIASAARNLGSSITALGTRPELFFTDRDFREGGREATTAAEALAAALYRLHESRAARDGWLDDGQVGAAHHLVYEVLTRLHAGADLRAAVTAADEHPDLAPAARQAARDVRALDQAATEVAQQLGVIAGQVEQLDAQLDEAEQDARRELALDDLAGRLASGIAVQGSRDVHDVVDAIRARLQAITEVRAIGGHPRPDGSPR